MRIKFAALALAAILAAPLLVQAEPSQKPGSTDSAQMLNAESLDSLYDGTAKTLPKQHVPATKAGASTGKSNVNEYYGKLNAAGNSRGKAPAASMPKLSPAEDMTARTVLPTSSDGSAVGTAVRKAFETVQKTIGAATFKNAEANSFNTATLTGIPGAKPITTDQLEPWTVDEDKPGEHTGLQHDAAILGGNNSSPETIKIVSAPLEALEKIAAKQLYKERSQKLSATYDVGPSFALGGAGYFKAKVLNANEIKNDPLRQQIRDTATAGGQEIVFLRTNTKAQLFGKITIPINVNGISASSRLTGTIEILETRIIPRKWADAYQYAKQRVILWPLTAKTLRDDLKVGEDITITGRLECGSGVSAGTSVGVGNFAFGNLGAGVSSGVGHARDKWVSYYIKKLDNTHVRVVVQDGNGEVFSNNLRLYAGLDIYDDSVIPNVNSSDLESTKFGAAIVKGEVKILNKLEKLVKIEIVASFTNGKHGSSTEGWSYISLTDSQTASALDRLLKFDTAAMRELPAQATSRGPGMSGKMNLEMRDVTQDSSIQFRLSKLHLTKASGAAFHEIIWSNDDGQQQHYLVGTVKDSFRNGITDTKYIEESTLWYNMNTGEYQVTVLLDPHERLLTTTREAINDVIATQRAMGAAVEAKIDHPSLYLQLFGMGNYGRTTEKGYFTVLPAGLRRMATKTHDEALMAYLKADWIYERESFPPGGILNAGQIPPWATAASAAEIGAALSTLDGAAAIGPGGFNDDSSMMRGYEHEYAQIAPKRFLHEDLLKYMAAKSYADHFSAMTANGIAPEKVMECFLAFRRDSTLELKRSVAATAMLARGNANDPGYAGYLEMTGNSVTLKPVGLPNQAPQTPIGHVNGMLASWKQ